MTVHVMLRLLALLAALAPWGNALAQNTPEASGSRLNDLPRAFVENQGQWEDTVHCVSSTGQLTARFESDAVVLCRRAVDNGAVVRFSFEGASDETSVHGESPLPGVYNFFVGEQSTWRTDVRGYESILYRGMYHGVDIRVRDRDGRLEYDVLLERAADLERVVVRCDGVDTLEVDENGSLVLTTPVGDLVQARPETWQVMPDGQRSMVECRYRLIDEARYGFEAPDGDPSLAMVVDPGLDWSTFLGGNANDMFDDVALAENGDVVAAGMTYSTNFPFASGAFATNKGSGDAFVVRMDPDQKGGAQLVYATYLGGSSADRCRSVTVDDLGVITVAGWTESTNFPVTKTAYDRIHNGVRDVFVCRLDPALSGQSQLFYSTFIGGSQNDSVNDHYVDSAKIITVAGWTKSTTFPTTPSGALNGPTDGFLLRLDPSLSGSAQLLYSTLLGGSGDDIASGAVPAVDGSGVATVLGRTDSANFPTSPGAYQTVYHGGHPGAPWDAFVVQIDFGAVGPPPVVYSTYFGGSEGESPNAVAVDGNGQVIVANWTISKDMPTTSKAYQKAHANPGTYTASWLYSDCHVARLDPTQTGTAQLVAATFLGGTGGDGPNDVCVDGSGTVILTGSVNSANFPTTPGAFDETFNGGGTDPWDAFVARLDPSLENLLYCSYIGGAANYDYGYDLAVDEEVAAVIGGVTQSYDFPTSKGAYHPTLNQHQDCFLTRLDLFPTGAEPYGTSTAGCRGPIAIGVNSMPQQGNLGFQLLCVNAPPSGTGYILVSLNQLASPISAEGVDLWIDPSPGSLLPLLAVPADSLGYCVVPVPLPPATAGYSFYAQFAWLPNPCGPQPFSASNAVAVTIQP